MSPEIKICQGDIRTWLPKMNSNSVDCVVTSPPYWGLRDYGTAKWEGGDPNCLHRAPDEAGQTTKPSAGQREHAGRFAGAHCYSCGARRIDVQIGLEPTYQQYIDELTTIFRELRRVLKPTGTLWLNLGDSYVGGGRGGNPAESKHRKQATNFGSVTGVTKNKWPVPVDLKPKDLCGIPWRVALALQADGWYLRQDIIWHKPNPMPESVTDRCTKAHEYLFLLTKSKDYYFDAKAIREPAQPFRHAGKMHPRGWHTDAVPISGGKKSPTEALAQNGRNRRSVWTITTTPFKEAHFATFPPKLVEPCILAGCPPSGIVLDPFAGAGTVGLVAKSHNRHAILVELNPDYCKMIEKRLACSPSS